MILWRITTPTSCFGLLSEGEQLKKGGNNPLVASLFRQQYPDLKKILWEAERRGYEVIALDEGPGARWVPLRDTVFARPG